MDEDGDDDDEDEEAPGNDERDKWRQRALHRFYNSGQGTEGNMSVVECCWYRSGVAVPR